MLREFFWSGSARTRAAAWLGLGCYLAHAGFKAYLKWRLNQWYESFYDVMGQSVERGSGDSDALAEARARVADGLVEFAWVVAPAIVVHPLFGLIRNFFCLEWRLSLIDAYLRQWDLDAQPVPCAAQRLHEDTARFAAGVSGCVSTVLDALLTLAVFAPLLYAEEPRLMAIAAATALGGLAVSVVVGSNLVGLEVRNQDVESALRTKLVLLETDSSQVTTSRFANLAFYRTLADLRGNYAALYRNFAALATWLASFEQAVTVLPYFLVAHRLFAPAQEDVITLGRLVKITNAFSKTFDSLNTVSDSWLSINEFRSVVRRLSVFERATQRGGPAKARLVEMAAATEI